MAITVTNTDAGLSGKELLTASEAHTITGIHTYNETPVMNDGIKFPASQVASADVNTLDDYEEGTFTPDLLFGGASTGITYTSRSGAYTKIGNLVHVELAFILSSKGSASGSATVTSLPFAASFAAIGAIDVAANAVGLTGAPLIAVVSQTVHILQTSATGRVALSDANFSNTTDVRISLSYRT